MRRFMRANNGMKLKIEVIDESGARYVGEATVYRNNRKTQNSSAPALAQDVRLTCSVALQQMWQLGRFKQALSRKRITEALSARAGYNFTGEALSMALSRARFLTRRGSRNSYTWIQKYPHGV